MAALTDFLAARPPRPDPPSVIRYLRVEERPVPVADPSRRGGP